MNVSSNRNGSNLFRRLIVWMPLSLACCVSPSTNARSTLTHSGERALTALQETKDRGGQESPKEPARPDVRDIKTVRRGEKYITDMHLETDELPQIYIYFNPGDNHPVALPQYYEGTPSQMWWNYSTSDNGTMTISAVAGKINSVLGGDTPNGAHIALKEFNGSGDIVVTVRNGGASGPIVVNAVTLAPSTGSGGDSATLRFRLGEWRLEVIHGTKRIDLDVEYAP